MSLSWIQSSKKILERITELEEMKEKDRLEYVRSMRFMLLALSRSLKGWMQWIDNPNVMVRFPEKDLSQMNKRLTDFTRSFIEFDLEISEQGMQKGLKDKKKPERKGESIYV